MVALVGREYWVVGGVGEAGSAGASSGSVGG